MKIEDLENIKVQVQSKPKPDNFPIKLIALDGHGGSGKSTIAKNLAKLFNAEIIQMDDFDSILEKVNTGLSLKKKCSTQSIEVLNF